jgi:hypothetical protein
MTPAEIEQRRRQLAVEWDDVDAQLEWLAEMRTVPWGEAPADMEGRLLLALDSLEYELGCLDFLERDGELPAALELAAAFPVSATVCAAKRWSVGGTVVRW